MLIMCNNVPAYVINSSHWGAVHHHVWTSEVCHEHFIHFRSAMLTSNKWWVAELRWSHLIQPITHLHSQAVHFSCVFINMSPHRCHCECVKGTGICHWQNKLTGIQGKSMILQFSNIVYVSINLYLITDCYEKPFFIIHVEYNW